MNEIFEFNDSNDEYKFDDATQLHNDDEDFDAIRKKTCDTVPMSIVASNLKTFKQALKILFPIY